jgi:hypothetical protein
MLDNSSGVLFHPSFGVFGRFTDFPQDWHHPHLGGLSRCSKSLSIEKAGQTDRFTSLRRRTPRGPFFRGRAVKPTPAAQRVVSQQAKSLGCRRRKNLKAQAGKGAQRSTKRKLISIHARLLNNHIRCGFLSPPVPDQFTPCLNELLHKRCARRPVLIELAHLQACFIMTDQLRITHLAEPEQRNNAIHNLIFGSFAVSAHVNDRVGRFVWLPGRF